MSDIEPTPLSEDGAVKPDLSRHLSVTLAAMTLAIWLAVGLFIGLEFGFAANLSTWLGLAAICIATVALSAYVGHNRAHRISLDLEAFRTFTEAYASGRQGTLPPKLRFKEIRLASEAVTGAAAHLTARIRALETAAYKDPVTGLPNHAELERVMKTHLEGPYASEASAFVHLKLEGYSQANELLGSLSSHALLSLVAQRFLDNLDGLTSDRGFSYTLSALKGERFGLFLPGGIERSEISTIVRGLSVGLTAPFVIDGRHVSLGLSGGISIAPDDGHTADVMIRNAELAMAQLTSEERTGFEFFTPRLDRIARGRNRLENELRAAVAANAFKPVFQPKVCFETGKISGAEALARWQRGEGRIISPAAFIPIAEQLGLIEDVGEQILRSACHAAAKWIRAGHVVNLAVNVSPRQFERRDFTDTVIDALRQSGLPPRWLELEITETLAVSDPDRVADVMRPLRAMGVRLAIDDFGTGHANLSMLTQLPFDIFKIDRQFVSALQSDRQAPAIVEMILAMAETLELETVAEGVETPAQADFLRRRGCALGQGFLYSQGISEPAFIALLEEWDQRLVVKKAGFAGP